MRFSHLPKWAFRVRMHTYRARKEKGQVSKLCSLLLLLRLNIPTAYRSVAVGLQLHKFNSCLEVYGLIVELWSLGAIDDVIQFITSGSIGGLPPIVVMIIPFTLG